MADIFSGIAPPNVNTTQTTQTIAPAQYLGFLSTLGTAGTNALDPNQTLQGNIAAGQPYVAPLSANQQTAFGNASDVAQTYQAPLSSAIGTANTAATPVGQSQINNFLNPYVTDVNKALETNTAQNVNQNILPALQAFYAGSGGTGSSRALNTTGQTLANIQTGLGAQESTNLSDAYKNAVTAALQSQSNLSNVANVQGNLASTGQTAANAAETNLANLGAQEQAQTQAQINAPLSTANNVSTLLKGYTVPTGTTQTYNGPASSYGASPLAQIAGLGTLFASGANGTSAIQGLMKTFGVDPNALSSYTADQIANANSTNVPTPSSIYSNNPVGSGLGSDFNTYLAPNTPLDQNP